MATKNRLMCYKNNLVLITDKRISKIFHLNTDEVKREIDKAIEKEKTTAPIELFKKAIENLLPEYTFGAIRSKKNIYGEEVSIYDSIYYQNFRQYIEQKEELKEIKKLIERRKKEKKQYWATLGIVETYHGEKKIRK